MPPPARGVEPPQDGTGGSPLATTMDTNSDRVIHSEQTSSSPPSSVGAATDAVANEMDATTAALDLENATTTTAHTNTSVPPAVSSEATMDSRAPGGINTSSASSDPSVHTRSLLRSLQDLRDSLAVRVDQLSLAIDRLRGQASELERAATSGSALSPGFGRPSSTTAIFESLLLPRPYVYVTPPSTRRPGQPGSLGSSSTTAESYTGNRLRSDLSDAPRSPSQQPVFRRGPTPPPEPPLRRRMGLRPTNLHSVAIQPEPMIVRSPSPSISAESPGQTETFVPSPLEVPAPQAIAPSASSGSAMPSSGGIMVETTTMTHRPSLVDDSDSSSGSMEEAFPLLHHHLDLQDGFERAATESRSRRLHLPPDMTLTGLRVRERMQANVAQQETRPETPVAPTPVFQTANDETRPPGSRTGRRELENDISQAYQRLEQARREWYHHWELERTHALHNDGRVPSEISTNRENAVRRTGLGRPRPGPFHPTGSGVLVPAATFDWNTPPSRAGSTSIGSRRWPGAFTDLFLDSPATDTSRLDARRRERPRETMGSVPNIDAGMRAPPAMQEDGDLLPRPGEPEHLANLRAAVRDISRRNGISFSVLADRPDDLRDLERPSVQSVENSLRIVSLLLRDLATDPVEDSTMQRVLGRIDLILASPNIPSNLRTRLQHMADREYRRRLRPSNGVSPYMERFDPGSTRLPSQTDPIVERIERSRLRVRNLTRVYDELQAARATLNGLGLESSRGDASGSRDPREPGERAPPSRRGSDAETVVPSTFSPGDVVTFESHDSPPVPAPSARLQDLHRATPSTTHVDHEAEPQGIVVSGLNESSSVQAVAMEALTSSSSSASSSSHQATTSHSDESAMDRKETGELHAQDWPQPQRRREPRPYISLLDLEL